MWKNKLFSQKISKFELTLRLGFYFLAALLSASFIIFVFFFYQKFYLTLTQAEEIIILKSQLAVDNLNLDLLQKVQKFEEEKSAVVINFKDLKNPFAN